MRMKKSNELSYFGQAMKERKSNFLDIPKTLPYSFRTMKKFRSAQRPHLKEIASKESIVLSNVHNLADKSKCSSLKSQQIMQEEQGTPYF
jgi:hypothetical protein